MALYWLDVSNITRRAAPGTLQAHGNYVLRESARQHVIGVGFPTNKHAIKRDLKAYEEWAEGHTRKDARLVYKIMHALPRELGRKGQIEATRRFLWELTMKGRGRGFAAFHDLDTDNPHVHIVFIDRDKNGKSVALLSASKSDRAAKGLEPNSTEWLRQLWELECNGVLAEHGLDVRIDRRTNLERGLAAAAEQHRGWKEPPPEEVVTSEPEKHDETAVESHPEPETSPEPTPECPPMPVDAPLEIDTVHGPEDPEEAMPEEMPAPARVGFATDMYNQLLLLRKTQSKVEYLGQQLSSAVRNLHEAEEEAPQYTEAMYQAKNKADAARDKLKQYQKSNGKLKGVDLWVWKSPTRKLGEEAALQAHALEAHFENAQKDYEAAQNKYERYKNEVASYSEQKAQSEDELTTLEKTLGNVSDLEQAEEIITYNVAQSLKDIDADQLKQMVQDGEISEGEYVDALTILNTPSAQLALDDYQRDDGQGY